MNVFIGMEESQVIQQAFEERGHNAWSCDFKPGRLNPSRHIQGNVHEVLRSLSWTPDILIFHPTCRYLSVSGQHWNDKPGQRTRVDVDRAAEDFLICSRYAGRSAIENPIGIMSKRWRKPEQIFQPYEFGDNASKRTCMWLIGLPKLEVDLSARCDGRLVEWPRGSGCIVERWDNQTDSGQNRLAPTKDPEDRRAARATTYPGPAVAMADQWGSL